jgi:2,3-bisphosphoglycerate-independent phosphoglycerate mutase
MQEEGQALPKPLVLIIIDGWGIGTAWGGNAIAIARTPNMDKYWRNYPHSTLISFGEAVGLPKGERGNSEVGHLSLGAGRVVHQDLPAISGTITNGSFFKNDALINVLSYAKQQKKNVHLMGLVSEGGVHSHIEHLFALLDLCHQQGVSNVFIHMFTDGRDSRPTDALLFLDRLQKKIRQVGIGRVISVSGRYFAMDRDKHWERVQKVYDALTQGYGIQSSTPEQAIAQAYRQGRSDEFIPPTVIHRADAPFEPIESGDVVISFNFRADRARQIAEALLDPHFAGFARKIQLDSLRFVSFVFHKENDRQLVIIRAFKPEEVEEPFAQIIAESALTQLHIAETEKYAHVTYFFNGGREDPFPGEDRIIIPSPSVSTYNLQPEMATVQITDVVLKDIRSVLPSRGHDVIIVNFAAPDMVGHTGDFNATVAACEAVDRAVGRITEAILSSGGVVAITADHGNAEEMVNRSTGLPDTEHIADPVPFILVSADSRFHIPLRQHGGLTDVAPTLLILLGLPIPQNMTGTSLIEAGA